MDDILKSNFKVKKPVKVDENQDSKKEGHQKLAEEFRAKALASLGGSMIYVERKKLEWDGDKND